MGKNIFSITECETLVKLQNFGPIFIHVVHVLCLTLQTFVDLDWHLFEITRISFGIIYMYPHRCIVGDRT